MDIGCAIHNNSDQYYGFECGLRFINSICVNTSKPNPNIACDNSPISQENNRLQITAQITHNA